MSPGIAVRLADATPWIVLDVVVPGLALVLLSRVWGMVAPGLGRRLGRLALVFGLPLLLVASVVGHVAAPEEALALSDGVDFTAFVLCFPLGAVWLGSLLLRLARWLLGREAAPRRALTRAVEWLRLGAVTLPVLGVVALVQWDAARDEVKATQQRARDLQTMIRALEATEQKAAEFARERELLAEKLEVLNEITPRSPETAELVARLEARAGEYQLRILEWSSSAGERGEDVLLAHQLTLVLGGDLERVKELVERSQKLSRLLAWRRVTIRAGRATALVTSYSAPDPEAAPSRRDVCTHPRSKVWLWPYTAKVRVAGAELDGLCAERERHADTRAQVDDFQTRKARLTELVLAIEKVRNGWRMPEIALEPEPPAEAPPLPSKRT